MKKKLKRFFVISGIVFSSLVILLVASFLVIYLNKSWVRSYLEKTVSKKDGTQLKIGRLDYGLFPLSVQADSVKVLQVIGGMEIEITLERLDIKGQLGRILKKKRPFFRSIDATEMTCRVLIKEIEEEMEIDYQLYIRQLADALSYLEGLEFKNFSFQYITPTGHTYLEKCIFTLSGTGKEGEYDYSLSSEEIEQDSPFQDLFLAGAFQSSGKLSLVEVPSIEAEFSAKPSQFEFRGNNIPVPELGLRIKGEFPLERFFPGPAERPQPDLWNAQTFSQALYPFPIEISGPGWSSQPGGKIPKGRWSLRNDDRLEGVAQDRAYAYEL